MSDIDQKRNEDLLNQIKRFEELNPHLFKKGSEARLARTIKGMSRKEYYRKYSKKYRRENTSSIIPNFVVVKHPKGLSMLEVDDVIRNLRKD